MNARRRNIAPLEKLAHIVGCIITSLSSVVLTIWFRRHPSLLSTHNREFAAASEAPTSVLGAATLQRQHELSEFQRLLQELHLHDGP